MNWVWRVAFSPNGDKVASASEDGTVRIWKVADVTDNQLPITETDGVMGVAFADASTVFFTAGGVSGVEAKRQGVNNP
jgi:WD40 repeat protein